jgi:hypothetical protein
MSACRKFAAEHSFDPASGWCAHGCGTREDGRMVKSDRGVVAPGHEYTPEELAELREKMR